PENMHYLDPHTSLSETDIKRLAASYSLPLPNPQTPPAEGEEEENVAAPICWQSTEGEEN
ncbi:MAG: hypothetical protein J6Y94_02505, partial [Bacteriovoracaceae bacterium]|nr:hypothetical protein [Bacteriovoracaceae bacterium]